MTQSIKNPIAILLILYTTFITILIFTQNQSSSIGIIANLLTIIIMLLIILLMLSLSSLKPESLLIYGLEKLSKTSRKIYSKRYGKPEYYVQYYYAILTYYKKIIRTYRDKYQDDIVLRTKSPLIPLLCSQGLINDTENKNKLIKVLRELGRINPDKNPSEFTNKMTYIENNILKDINDKELKDKIYDIFRHKSLKERVREYLFYLVAILSVLGAVFNTFRDFIFSFLGDLI